MVGLGMGKGNLRLQFSGTPTNNMNPRVKEVSFQPYTQYPVYQKLENEVFAQRAHCVNGTVSWHEMTDFDLDTLYLESEPITGN